ncbi:MAG: phosphatidylserine decarboxylase [Verrucomicrobiae bacterium]|nr:phosphatidylserine decarboxylase [Verrucomicrobiae bacterium]
MNDWIIIGGGAAVGVAVLWAASVKWCIQPRFTALMLSVGAACGIAVGCLINRAGWPQSVIFLAVPAVQLAFYVGFIAWRFYRDPERTPPPDPAVVVSPADGKIVYIRKLSPNSVLRCDKKGAQLHLDELEKSSLAAQELWQVGISMVFTDVHINRSPIAGKVILAQHRPGKFWSLRIPEAINVNERQTMLFDNGKFQVALVQIASRLVRRIEAYVREGQQLDIAQRIGMIKFGSQVDLFLPVNVIPLLDVKEGDELVAGETVVGKFTR